MTKIINNPTNKKGPCFKTDSFDISVIKDPDLKPFLNVFQIEGQNIQQQKLGKLFGIIQVDDHSENSEYLPNLLTQIFKKEYYKNKNKKCNENFEKALHKLNLTLSELTQHEIVKWINNLNAVIGVICENEIHFTQIGNGCLVFFKKNSKIVKIDSELDQENKDYHPMKTFSSVSSGKLKEGDKLFFALQEVFKTISMEELERHYKTFTSDEFDNLVSSTLKNEASNTALVVVNMKNQQEIISETSSLEEKDLPKTENLNFFGNQKKSKTISPQKDDLNKNEGSPKEKIRSKEISEKNPRKNSSESPFQYEPEIFIKEDDFKEEVESIDEKSKLNTAIDTIQEFSKKTNSLLKTKFNKNQIKKISFNQIKMKRISSDVTKGLNKEKLLKISSKTLNWLKEKLSKINLTKIKTLVLRFSNSSFRFLSDGFKNKKFLLQKPTSEKFQKIANKIGIDFEIKQNKNIEVDSQNKIQPFIKKILKKTKEVSLEIIILVKNFLKNKKMIKIFIFILFVLALISLLIIIFNKKTDQKIIPPKEITQDPNNNTQEKTTNLEIAPQKLINIAKDIQDSTFLNSDLFLLTNKNSLIKFSTRNNSKTEILLPENFKNPIYLSAIDSLQLIFIISSSEIYSYSPITNNFSKNTIQIPDNSEITGAGTYLTYLYLLDKKSNQVYRYHRAPGGFGEHKNWLTSNFDLSSANNLSVSDSVYITSNNGKIEKYFQGEKVFEITLEENSIADKIRTKINQDTILALDQNQGKIVLLSDKGEIQKTLSHKEFIKASDFNVNFENRKIFIINQSKDLLSFNY
jgi:hypothetical protein